VVQVGRDSLVLVTGASGFVGSALCRALIASGYRVRRAVRAMTHADDAVVGDIDSRTHWSDVLQGVDAVVHLAARTHVLHETSADPLAEYRRINTRGTVRLARQAIDAGVKRLVFLSSVKVNGEATHGRGYLESDPARPEDAYGLSKWEAEQSLWEMTAGTRTQGVVLRPPLIYGPGVKGNFLRLMKLAARHWPLPLASIDNRRSLIYVENLVSAITTCLESPAAGNRTYLVSDGTDMSTPELVRAISSALGLRARLLRCPVSALRAAAAITGQTKAFERLAGSLQINPGKIGEELRWRPPFTPQQGMAATARWYHASAGGRSSTE
jgi:nucleoside-diphosphate-sugar epimerase